MKKVLMILLAFAMVFSMAGMVSATQDLENAQSGTTEISLTPDVGYLVTLPTAVSIGENLQSEGVVEVKRLRLPSGSSFKIAVDSDNGYNLVSGSSSIAYTVSKKDATTENLQVITKDNNVILELMAATYSGSQTLVFATTKDNVDKASLSGKHTDTLTFTFSMLIKETPTTNEEFKSALKTEAEKIEIVLPKDEGEKPAMTWETGAQHGSTPLIDADNYVTKEVIIQGDTENPDAVTFVATGAGVGPIRAANGATLVFKDLTIKDESVSYAEGSWELGYLEFGGKLRFENCKFESAITIDGDSAEFVDCTFNSGKDNEYAVWISSGTASFTNCNFNGARGIKIHECYGSDVTSVTVDKSTFTLSVKPGIVIGNVHTTAGSCTDDGHILSGYCSSENSYDGVFSLSVTNSDFSSSQVGDGNADSTKGIPYIFETDTPVDKLTITNTGNTVPTDL